MHSTSCVPFSPVLDHRLSLGHAPTDQIEEHTLLSVLGSANILSHATRDSSRACAHGTRGSLGSTLELRVRTPMIEGAPFPGILLV